MHKTHDELRAAARTFNNEPTLTDQSGAAETDLNVVLKRYFQSGTIHSHNKQPMYLDWSQYPEDFRDYIETARKVDDLRADLPEQLRSKTTEELLALTPEQLQAILTPAEPPANPPAPEPPK